MICSTSYICLLLKGLLECYQHFRNLFFFIWDCLKHQLNLVWFSLHDKKYVNSERILDLADLTIIFVDVTTLWSFCVFDWTFEITVSNQIYTIATFRYIGKKLPGKQGFFAIEVKFCKLHLLVVSWTRISLWYNRFSTTSFRYTFPVSGDDGSLCQFQHQMDWYIILSRYVSRPGRVLPIAKFVTDDKACINTKATHFL